MIGFPRYMLALLLCLCATSVQGQVFVPGHSGQPLAPLFSGRDLDDDDSYYNGTSSRVVNERIPWHIKAANGDDLVFVEIRDGKDDFECSGIGMKRRAAGSSTWSKVRTVYVRSDFKNNEPSTGGGTYKWVSGGSAVLNDSGRLFVFFTKADTTTGTANHVTTVFYTHSDDHGVTWETPVEITSTVKKASNASPADLPACYDEADAAWGWYRFGPHEGIRTATGRLIIPAFHRYTTDQAGPSWSHCIISDDDGATWYLGGGFQETVAGNDGTNELALVLLSTGDFYGNCRVISGGNGNKRGQVIIPAADITTTWPAMSVMTDGTNDVYSNSTAGSACVDSDGNVWVACPNDDTIRARVTVHKSTNNGTSFPSKRVLDFGYSGYSAIWETTTPGTFDAVIECTDDYANAGTTDGTASAQVLRIKRFDTTWFDNESTYPAVADYHLNDGVAGEATYTAGTEIQAFQGYCPPGKGGANATWHADGIAFGGSGAGIQLQEAQAAKFGGMCDIGLGGAITFEGEFFIPATVGADATLWDNNNASATAKGCSFVIQTADKKIRARFNDGTNSCTKVTTATYNDGAWHTYQVTYQRGVGCTIKIDGVADGSAQADNLTSSTAIAGAQPFRVGSRGGGSNPMVTGAFCRRFRVTRGIPAVALTANEAKLSIAQQCGYSPLPYGGLPSTTNLKMALFVPQFGTTYGYGSADRFGGQLYPVRPPLDGSGLASYRDHSSLGRMFRTYTVTAKRNLYWDTDSTYGRHVRLGDRGTQNLVSWIGRTAASTDYDFIQNTGRFTLMFAVNFQSNQFSTNQVLFDNCTASAAQPGFRVDRNTNGTLQVGVSAGTIAMVATWRLNEASAFTLSDNTWYFIAIVGNQASAKLDIHRATYSSGLVGSLTSVQTSGSLDANGSVASPANTPSTGLLSIGARNDDSRACNARIGAVLLFDESMNATQVGNWAAVMNTSPVSAALPTTNGLNLGIGIGLGANERPRIKVPDEYTLAP